MLNFNQVTDLKPLFGLKNLETLMLTGNLGLDDDQVEELEEALPRCEIEHC